MKSSEFNSEEEDSKEEMPKLLIPQFDLVQQSDENGIQKIPSMMKASWISSLCNCFRVTDSNYHIAVDNQLLGAQSIHDVGKNTLVLDLDETLVHSTFSHITADITIEIEIERQKFKVYALKRPGVSEFLRKCSELYEVVIFTASLSAYADPLLDILDDNNLVSFRLFRESCSFINNCYVKDLARLGRDLKHLIIVDVRLI